ncbi:hypothetical protein HU200_036750 [Digitaria exilis]|uniref:Sugar transporter SWEET n=1 Tax=Digitaria exilis TaxID=1010633 RepID=A0A835ELF1_9POAL|nr:hypothetical protein HU200_036750 [Digitaria exilis]
MSVQPQYSSNINCVSGCVYSLLSFCGPIITLWSTASTEATTAFHSWLNLLASALGCFAWLLFSLSQLHGEAGQIVGAAAVVVNAIGFAFYAMYIVIKLAAADYLGTMACSGVILVFFGAYISAILVSVYGPIKRESREALIISFVPFVLQIISQVIPLVTVCSLLWSMIFPPENQQRPEHINRRKGRKKKKVSNFGLSLFWVAYCSMIYEHDFFQLANDVGAVLALLSMFLYLVYTLRPHDMDYPPAPAEV